MEMRIAAVQLGPWAGNWAKQMAMVEAAALAAARAHSPRVILLPELISSPYFCTTEDPAFFGRYAEEIPGPTTERLGRVARQTEAYVIASLFERQSDAHYNAAAVISPAGELVGRYRKTHIPLIEVPGTWTNEKFYFQPGEQLSTFDLDGVRIGILICYDRSFPEAWRVLALQGAQVILVPASSSGFRHAAFVSELRTRALESGVWVVAANKAGDEPEPSPKHFYGRSCIISPTGEVVQELDDTPGRHLGHLLGMGQVEEARRRLAYLRDRRPELYGALAERKG